MSEGGRIPKIIHFCWFGKEGYSEKIISCMKTWKKWLPDYEIRLWNESNFDVNSCTYTKEAYLHQKYAFVSDYVRMYALYFEGGVYLDTDVELCKSLDFFLDNDAFCFFSKDPSSISTWILGAKPEHPWVRLLLDYYKEKHFVNNDGTLDLTPNICVGNLTSERYHFIPNGVTQLLADGLTLYSREYVGGHDFETGLVKITENTYCIHWNEASWWDEERRADHKRLQGYRRKYGRCGDFVYYMYKMKLIIKEQGIRSALKKIYGVLCTNRKG